MSDIVERLAPCPFCGGRAEIYGGLFPPLGPRYGVTCRGECKTFLDCRCVHQAEAIAAWNRRSDATITALREEVEEANKAAWAMSADVTKATAELTALRQRVVEVVGPFAGMDVATVADYRAARALINEIKETTDGH